MTPRRTILLSLGAFVLGLAAAPAGFAQQPPAPAPPESPRPSILFQIAPPPEVRPNSSLTRDDVQHVPPPRPDRLSDSGRITVTVGDPRCLPGEDDDWVYLPGGRRHRRY